MNVVHMFTSRLRMSGNLLDVVLASSPKCVRPRGETRLASSPSSSPNLKLSGGSTIHMALPTSGVQSLPCNHDVVHVI